MKPLDGVRVVDVSAGRAGAVATMFLADFGADVIKPDDSERLVWDRGKRRVPALPRDADVVVTSTDYEGSDGTVVLRLPPTLDPCPWAGGRESDEMLSGWMGIALRQGSFGGGPTDSIYPFVTIIQGIWGAACALAALLERERSGRGQAVTVSGEHGAMVAAAGALTFRYSDLDAARRSGGPGGSIPFYRTYQCGDGEWLFFAALTPTFTRIGFEVLGITELFDDPRLEGRGRAAMIAPEHARWVTQQIAKRFMEAPRDDWLSKLRAAGCPSGAVLDRDSWLDHPQIEAIGMHARVGDEEFGVVEMPSVPLKIETAPGEERGSAAAGAGPLAGVRVLDLGAIIAGPFCASLLAELGADVIKVEPPAGDSFRGPGFAAYNKGQRGIVLDLRDPDGKSAFFDLVRTADVVVDNYRPGVLSRLGIEWEALRQVNPSIISATITGFGDGGPFGGDAGFDPVLQAMSGMMKAQGGDSDPVFFTVPVNDVVGSATLAFGCVLALFRRMRKGEACKVATSLAAMSALVQTEAIARYEGRPPSPVGSRDHKGPSALDRYYETSDGWVRVQASEAWTDDIDAWFRGRSRDEALRELFDAGIPAAPARTIKELASDPRMYETEVLHKDPRPDRDGATAGRHAVFSRTMLAETLVSPDLGQHTHEVLKAAGYSEERVDVLVERNAAR